MGVPAFFRWLTRKYPSVIVHCIEQKSVDINGVHIPIDLTEPNPNGVEFDNLYLDMNGIIHPCTHPEDKPAPRNEDEMMVAIFECIDRLFAIVRPRKLLYMAIDGVAPRAKMNQQRSRRFRASKEVMEKVSEISKVRAELLVKGAHLPPEKAKEEHFDSNCITPGTPFMARLSQCLHYYIHERMNSDPAWRGIKVILSDANVPGEGEHKIMDYIRKQRAQPDHDPNTQHCLCGADADLIMLGLATHEPNFTIIREEFKPNKPRPCDICGQLGHDFKDCLGVENTPSNELQTFSAEGDFIFVRLNVLREYLERELVMPNLPFEYDFERVIDDWVFMCFFVGNDFLPHLPSLEIREGAIDRLVRLYKDAVYKTGGFLTEDGNVNLDRVQLIMSELGKAEDEIFKKRQVNELAFKAREKAKKRRTEAYDRERRPDWTLVKDTQFEATPIGQSKSVMNARHEAYEIRKAGMESVAGRESGGSANDDGRRGQKRKFNESDDEDDQAHDEVRLWEDGFKDRYYQSKFDVASDNLEFRYKVALQYVRGLCWVLQYYYQGCASWKWYFPYHYAPFASDFINICGLSTQFEKGTQPFRPLEQLMGVFPAASRSHVPEPWGKLMTDPESPIIDFYPEDFKIDLNGKKFAWQGVALLPFVDETRLFSALKPYYELLSPQELARNVRGDDRLYLTTGNNHFNFVQELYKKEMTVEMEVAISFDGMRGTVLMASDCVTEQGCLDSPVKELPSISDNKVLCTKYRDPKYNIDFVFEAKKLKGAKLPPRVLKPEDLSAEQSRNWRPTIGMVPSNMRATVGGAGHRMLDHYAPRIPGQYSAVPPSFPPPGNNQRYGDYQQQRGYRQDDGRGGGGGGYGGQRGAGGGSYNYNRYNQGYKNYNQGSNQGYGGGRGGGGGGGGYGRGGRGGGGRGGYYGNQNRGGEQSNFDRRGNQHQSRPPGPHRDSYVPFRRN